MVRSLSWVLFVALTAPRFAQAEPLPQSLTPPAPAQPRINGPDVFGVRPGSPFLYTIPATGARPMRFGADNLPDGLQVDPATGRITGAVPVPGERIVVLWAANALGTAKRHFRIVVGDKIALTPPMGWNPSDCWSADNDQGKTLRAARVFVASGLIEHGWTYINIDDGWQGKRGGKFNAIQPNAKFPCIQAMVGEIHALGLKAGIYSTPWITSYTSFCGGSSDDPTGTWTPDMGVASYHRLGKFPFADNDARQLAAWGFDYLKYDWYRGKLPEIAAMSHALRQSGRDIVYSLSNSANSAYGNLLGQLANSWRTGDDLWDRWGDDPTDWQAGVTEAGFAQDRWAPFEGPGHWNDPDMLVVGWVGWGKKLHPTQLTTDQQYSHLSLWCMLSAPLIFSGDPDHLDPFTLGLLTNDEVLAVDQDALGVQATRVAAIRGVDILMKPLEDGSNAVGFFNRESQPEKVRFNEFNYIGFEGKKKVRDLWRQQDLPDITSSITVSIPACGVVLLRMTPVK